MYGLDHYLPRLTVAVYGQAGEYGEEHFIVAVVVVDVVHGLGSRVRERGQLVKVRHNLDRTGGEMTKENDEGLWILSPKSASLLLSLT